MMLRPRPFLAWFLFWLVLLTGVPLIATVVVAAVIYVFGPWGLCGAAFLTLAALYAYVSVTDPPFKLPRRWPWAGL